MCQNLIWLFRVFSPSFLKFLLPKPLILMCLQTEQSTIETAHINFMLKRVIIYSRIMCFLNFKTCGKFQKSPKNVPNTGRGEGVPSEANMSPIVDVPNSLGREGVSKLCDNVPMFTFLFWRHPWVENWLNLTPSPLSGKFHYISFWKPFPRGKGSTFKRIPQFEFQQFQMIKFQYLVS